jgi:hypothetical protein
MALKNAVRSHLSGTTVGTTDIDASAVTNPKLGDDTIRPGKLNRRHTFEEFKEQPIATESDATAASGATGATNVMLFPEAAFEYHIKGAGQTILVPVATATGLDISLDQTDDEGVEVSQGILARSRGAFTIGTDTAFFARCRFKIADVSGTDDCAFGFRKAAAYQANIDDYTDMAVLNVIAGDIKIETILNNGATSTTDTTDNWADGETHELQVLVSAGGVVTYRIDGAAPTQTAAFTFDTGDVVVPFCFFLHTTDLAGAVELIEWEVGFQADA